MIDNFIPLAGAVGKNGRNENLNNKFNILNYARISLPEMDRINPKRLIPSLISGDKSVLGIGFA